MEHEGVTYKKHDVSKRWVSSQRALYQHMLVVHQGVRYYCSKCKVGYTWQLSFIWIPIPLLRRDLIHSGEKPRYLESDALTTRLLLTPQNVEYDVQCRVLEIHNTPMWVFCFDGALHCSFILQICSEISKMIFSGLSRFTLLVWFVDVFFSYILLDTSLLQMYLSLVDKGYLMVINNNNKRQSCVF